MSMRIASIVALLLMSQGVSAEVSDKIPSFVGMWVQAVVFGVVFLFASFKKPWCVLLGLLFSLFLASGFYDMANDRFMYLAVIKEQGELYFLNGYASSFAVGVLALLGLIINRSVNARKNT
ncbi:hypothetical protein FIU95_07775 [Microbulbifer sp. THAF38]|nr:hypothetical protein FIU95_07775 [Microbulbifer sp. THAF38]